MMNIQTDGEFSPFTRIPQKHITILHLNMDDSYADYGDFVGFSIAVENCNTPFIVEWFKVNCPYDIKMEHTLNQYSLRVGPMREENYGAYYAIVYHGPNFIHHQCSRNANIYKDQNNNSRKSTLKIIGMFKSSDDATVPNFITNEKKRLKSDKSHSFDSIEEEKLNTSSSSNHFNKDTNNNQILSDDLPLKFIQEPKDQTCYYGHTVTLSAEVKGSNITYEWLNESGKVISTDEQCIFHRYEKIGISKYVLSVKDQYDHSMQSDWVQINCLSNNILQKSPSINNEQHILQKSSLMNSHRILQKTSSISDDHTLRKIINNLPPILFESPLSAVIQPGSYHVLTSKFENVTQYQWYKDNNYLTGCNSNELKIIGVNANNGDFCIVASNRFGRTISAVATIQVKFNNHYKLFKNPYSTGLLL